jgi:hypothetical protein
MFGLEASILHQSPLHETLTKLFVAMHLPFRQMIQLSALTWSFLL